MKQKIENKAKIEIFYSTTEAIYKKLKMKHKISRIYRFPAYIPGRLVVHSKDNGKTANVMDSVLKLEVDGYIKANGVRV